MSKKKPENNNLIDKITPEQASTVLLALWESGSSIKAKIEDIIREVLTDVVYKDVCDDVSFSLASLCVDDVYEHSGSRRDGYHDPGEVAIEMLEDACREHEEQLERYHELGMYKAEREYCKGVMLALYKFDQDADDDLLAQAPEMASETFWYILDKWKKRCMLQNHIENMDNFIATECSEWK